MKELRVKELKNLLNKMPDDAEIAVRAKMHKPNGIDRAEYAYVASATVIINPVEQKVILNPVRELKAKTWQPERNEMVECDLCKMGSRVKLCKSKDKLCSYCEVTCNCKLCDTTNIDIALPYYKRPMWEEKQKKQNVKK